jgi:hypothetical protein
MRLDRREATVEREAVTAAVELPIVVRSQAAATMALAAAIMGPVAGIMALPAIMADTKAGTNPTVTTAIMDMVTPTAFGSGDGHQDGGDRPIRIPDTIHTISPITRTRTMPPVPSSPNNPRSQIPARIRTATGTIAKTRKVITLTSSLVREAG